MTTHAAVPEGTVKLMMGSTGDGVGFAFSEMMVQPKANVVLVDTRSLYAECLLAALRVTDTAMCFSSFRSLDAWSAARPALDNTMVVLCLDGSELQGTAPGLGSLMEQIQSITPPVLVLVLSNEEHPAAIAKAIDMGIVGYIPTSTSLRVVVQILHLVHAGGIFVPASSLRNQPIQIESKVAPALPDIGGLSPRQILVAKALRKGTPNKVIAYELNMCESTVKVHVRQIMRKLKAKNRTQIAFLTNSMFNESASA